jgi:hypothetical protein
MRLIVVVATIFLNLYAWDGDKWGPMKREEIISIAKKMIDSPWSPNKICRGWNVSYDPPEFYPGKTYYGMLYTQNNPQENWEEFLAGITNLPYDYYGYWGTNNRWYNYYGTDCSGFVSICWKLPERYSTTLFYEDANGSRKYCYPLGSIGSSASVSLLSGDALNSKGNHIILFSHYSTSNTIISLEQTPNNAKMREWYYSSLQNYQPIRRNLLLDKKKKGKGRI